MPFRSEKQRKYMYAKHPEMAKRWQKEGKGGMAGSKRAPAAAAKKAAAKKKPRSTSPVAAKKAATPPWATKAPKSAQGAYRKAVARKRGK